MTFSTSHPDDAYGSRPKRILLVEDSDTVRVLTAEYLRSCGHDVIDVVSAEQALELLARARFDILFTDLSLPGMSGLDLAREAMDRSDDLSLILSSGFDHEPEMSVFGERVQFLAKPYDLSALDRALAFVNTPPH